ncbi:MAG: glycosyltransferase family protein, partial [Clostridium sp.]
MNEKIISFILCVNDMTHLRNCIYFLEQLIVPEGYNIEIVPVYGAKSITSGYNDGIKNARGKYKVYLHQDVYITNPYFIRDTLKVFESDENIGLIGLAGSKLTSNDGVWWNSPLTFGIVYEIRTAGLKILEFKMATSLYEEVDIVDGLLMMTQYDIPWRADVFDGWHYYDASQCMEFKRANKKVVIPQMLKPWCIHDCGVVSVENYETFRILFLNEYGDM